MATKRTKEPWMTPVEFARTLPRGIGVNLIVGDIDREIAFCRDVLGAMILHADEDFAAIELCSSVFMLHADHTYSDHPMRGIVGGSPTRGAGVEIRVIGLDPDRVEARARGRDDAVISGTIDKPHGLRECHVADPEGYVWVPSLPAPAK
ncbi:MAG TPA: hypothetical protein VFJ18_10010 [Pararhizobium sp.]|nr:hypothetical protein [Pararhizobium sp.]